MSIVEISHRNPLKKKKVTILSKSYLFCEIRFYGKLTVLITEIKSDSIAIKSIYKRVIQDGKKASDLIDVIHPHKGDSTSLILTQRIP